MRTVRNGERGYYFFENGNFIFFVGTNSFYGREKGGSEQVGVPVGTKLTLWGYEDPYEAVYEGNGKVNIAKGGRDFILTLKESGDAFIAEQVPESA